MMCVLLSVYVILWLKSTFLNKEKIENLWFKHPNHDQIHKFMPSSWYLANFPLCPSILQLSASKDTSCVEISSRPQKVAFFSTWTLPGLLPVAPGNDPAPVADTRAGLFPRVESDTLICVYWCLIYEHVHLPWDTMSPPSRETVLIHVCSQQHT